MADNKATKAEKYSVQSKDSLLERERKRLRTMKIIFAVFCFLLILAVLLALLLKP